MVLHKLKHLVYRNGSVVDATCFGENVTEFLFRQTILWAPNVYQNGVESIHLDSSLGTATFRLGSLDELLAETTPSFARETEI